MTLREYIDEQYPVNNLIEHYTKDPYTRVMNADFLPYDKICMYDGKLQKVVEISDDEVIPVLDLLSYDERDVVKCSQEFKDAYYAYMDNIVLESVDVQDIIHMSRNYKKLHDAKMERLQ